MLICLTAAVLTPQAMALEEPETSSPYIVLADMDTGTIYYSQNMDSKAYPASLTKIMTVMLAVEAVERGDASLYDRVEASVRAVTGLDEAGSTANIMAGEIMTLEDYMYCAMVESANEACNVIAEYIGGSIDEFVNMMNERAEELGCENTHFVNAHGLPDDNHYTTAHDMFIIASTAMQYDLFAMMCNTVTHTVPATNLSDARELSNTNGLINAESPYYRGYYYEYAKGVKTGHTSAAGYCLVSTAEKDGIKLMAVVLGSSGYPNPDGSNTYNCFADSIKLYEWVFNNFSQQEVLKSSELVAEVDVEMGDDTESVTLRPANAVTVLLPNDESMDEFKRDIRIYSEEEGTTLQAPIAAGEVLGEITIKKDGVTYGSSPLVASASVELSKLQYLKNQVENALNLVWVKIIFWLLILVIIVYILLVIRYRILHKRHKQAVRRARMERERRREAEDTARVFGSEEEKAGPAPQPPKVDYFTEEDVKRRASVKIPMNTPGSSGIDRDYFEEFFRNTGAPAKEKDDKNKE